MGLKGESSHHPLPGPGEDGGQRVSINGAASERYRQCSSSEGRREDFLGSAIQIEADSIVRTVIYNEPCHFAEKLDWTPQSHGLEGLADERDIVAARLEVDSQLPICSRKNRHGDGSRAGVLGQNDSMRLESGPPSRILGRAHLSVGLRDGLVNCLCWYVESRWQPVDEASSLAPFASEELIEAPQAL